MGAVYVATQRSGHSRLADRLTVVRFLSFELALWEHCGPTRDVKGMELGKWQAWSSGNESNGARGKKEFHPAIFTFKVFSATKVITQEGCLLI